MRRPHETLTTQELAIMKEVWRLKRATVRDVYEALRARRRVAYTTVMTMMNILADKGYLKKDTADRAHRYRPARARSAVTSSMIREFVNRVFDGAARPLLLHLARQRRLSDKEREAIRRLIEEVEP
jgi:BlaI family transcriptional regulator, penicillinase repressor